MIRDLGETLEQLVTTELPGVQVELVRPSEPYNPAQGLTTVNLFLYDIRENLELRSNEPLVQRNNNQATITRPPLRVACSYLVTAWPDGNTDLALREHRLLSDVLRTFARFPTIPPQFLQGSLAGQEPPLPSMIASGDGLQNPAEFWTAIGNRLKAAFVLTVTIGMDIFAPQQVPTVISARAATALAAEGPGGELAEVPGTREEAFRIGGAVTDAASQPVAGATVRVVETGVEAKTDADGKYNLGTLPAGAYTLRVTAGPVTQDFNRTVPAAPGNDFDLQLP